MHIPSLLLQMQGKSFEPFRMRLSRLRSNVFKRAQQFTVLRLVIHTIQLLSSTSCSNINSCAHWVALFVNLVILICGHAQSSLGPQARHGCTQSRGSLKWQSMILRLHLKSCMGSHQRPLLYNPSVTRLAIFRGCIN